MTGSLLLVVGLALIGLYAARQKKRAQKLVSQNNPFGTSYISYTLDHIMLLYLPFDLNVHIFQLHGDQRRKILVRRQNSRALDASHWKSSS